MGHPIPNAGRAHGFASLENRRQEGTIHIVRERQDLHNFVKHVWLGPLSDITKTAAALQQNG